MLNCKENQDCILELKTVINNILTGSDDAGFYTSTHLYIRNDQCWLLYSIYSKSTRLQDLYRRLALSADVPADDPEIRLVVNYIPEALQVKTVTYNPSTDSPHITKISDTESQHKLSELKQLAQVTAQKVVDWLYEHAAFQEVQSVCETFAEAYQATVTIKHINFYKEDSVIYSSIPGQRVIELVISVGTERDYIN